MTTTDNPQLAFALAELRDLLQSRSLGISGRR
jgi:hypothetical protein